MYSTEHQCAVLGDYDLAILLGIPRVRGTDRTGTVTFMAIDLLAEEYWNGLIKRQYHHELEAFVWVLPFVFFRYQGGVAVPNTVVEEWMTSDYAQCHKEKSSFLRKLREHRRGEGVQPDFKEVWPIAFQLLSWLFMESAAALLRDDSSISEATARAGFVNAVNSVPRLEYLNDLLQYLRSAPA